MGEKENEGASFSPRMDIEDKKCRSSICRLIFTHASVGLNEVVCIIFIYAWTEGELLLSIASIIHLLVSDSISFIMSTGTNHYCS